jgi:beta-xylosidase
MLRQVSLSVLLLAAAWSPIFAEDARPDAVPAKCYLFSYFIGNGEDGLHLAWSRDGYKWEALNGGRSYLAPTVGESKLMRDPSLWRAADGTFHLVWTTAWKGKTIGYASSKDLLHWSEETAVPVMAGETNVQNCWAPELFFDKATAQYLIFWASTIKGRNPHPDADGDHQLYYVATRDFRTFTPAKLFFDPGFSVIDGTVLARDGRYYLIFKDERKGPPARKYLQIAEAEKAEGPWTKISKPFTDSWVEGPTHLTIGDEVIVYFDCYTRHHYGAMKSKDLVNWVDVTDKLSLPQGVRHGTTLEVPGFVISALSK